MTQNRPLYETGFDKENERRAFPLIARHFGHQLGGAVSIEKLPDRHFADIVIVDGSGAIRSYVEYKKRRMAWGDYPTIMLSASKYLRLDELRNLSVSAFFAVEDRHGEIRMVDLLSPATRMHVVWGGRTAARRDTMDVEPVCHFPIEDFRSIGNVESTQ